MCVLAHAYGTIAMRTHSGSSFPPTMQDQVMMARHAELIVDQPWFLLWPCLIPWMMFEAIMGYAWLHNLHREF